MLPIVLAEGKTICTGSDDATMRIWNPKSGEIVHIVRGIFLLFMLNCNEIKNRKCGLEYIACHFGR